MAADKFLILCPIYGIVIGKFGIDFYSGRIILSEGGSYYAICDIELVLEIIFNKLSGEFLD